MTSALLDSTIDALLEEQWNVAAVMKGYTARKAVALLETMQVDRAILYLGSTVQTFGRDQAWEIAIPNPAGGEERMRFR